ncbi:MAG: hypothetical protein FJ009_14210 [Chloroflexi bacterium]|nr:hypothetical protein [Chloroflexota bacterium]
MRHRGAQPKRGNVLRPHQYSTIEYMSGPSRKGPKRCLRCHKSIKQGEPWQRVTSPADPKYGSYVVGIHTNCSG